MEFQFKVMRGKYISYDILLFYEIFISHNTYGDENDHKWVIDPLGHGHSVSVTYWLNVCVSLKI